MSEGAPRAAVLAGGLGTRIRSVGGMTPKVLLPVAGRPFLAHLLDYLARQGIAEAVLCLGHAADAVAAAARAHRPDGLELVESRETAAMGTGGAIRDALALLGGTFYIINGDTYLDAPLPRLLDLHRSTGAMLTLSLVRSPLAAEKGTVRVAPGGRVLDFAEKTSEGSGLINAGAYVAEADLFEAAPPVGPCSLERDIIPEALRRGMTVMGHVVEAPFVDIGLPEDYLRVRDGLPGGNP
jgi:NDP-sugar pyrophosphorylase family protein